MSDNPRSTFQVQICRIVTAGLGVELDTEAAEALAHEVQAELDALLFPPKLTLGRLLELDDRQLFAIRLSLPSAIQAAKDEVVELEKIDRVLRGRVPLVEVLLAERPSRSGHYVNCEPIIV